MSTPDSRVSVQGTLPYLALNLQVQLGMASERFYSTQDSVHSPCYPEIGKCLDAI